jgi:hypothetical protein
MIQKELDKILINDIEELVTNKTREGKFLEFKQEIKIGGEGERKEFLADVSSFANTSGGYIIFGIKEEKGQASQIIGVNTSDPDSLTLQMESMIRDGIRKRIAYRIKFLEIAKDEFIILIQIPESFDKPHRVTYKGSDKYFSRGENGKHQMDHDEVGRAFNETATASQKIEFFVHSRIKDIEENVLPVSLAPNGKVAIHLLPRNNFLSNHIYNLSDPAINLKMICPLGGGNRNPGFNEDGLISSSGIRQEYQNCYVQVYKNGSIETVNGDFLYPYQGELRIPVAKGINYELFCINTINDYLEYYKKMGIQFPVYLIFSLIGCRGYYVAGETFRYPFFETRKLSKNVITSGLLTINTMDDNIPALLKPAFDTIWNGCGFSNSKNFSEQGDWQPIR